LGRIREDGYGADAVMTDSGWKMEDGLESRNLSHSRAERDRQLEELSEAVKLKKIWEDVPEVILVGRR
jgi:hypothetical protein